MVKKLTWKQALANEGRGWLRSLGFKSFHENPTKFAHTSPQKKAQTKMKCFGVPGYYPGQIEYRARMAKEKLERETEQRRINLGRRKPRKSKLKSKRGAW